jgi:tripartite-type tricarboxylate transporter receptor subunit TctC
VTALKRSPVLPDLPTFDESGIPGYELTTWAGLAVPVRVPREIAVRLNTEINKALQSPAVSQFLTGNSLTPEGGTPERFNEHVRKETEKLGKLIRTIGIKPQ